MGHTWPPQRKAIAETRFHTVLTVLTWFFLRIPSQPPPHVVTMPEGPFSGKQVPLTVSQVGSSQGQSIPSNKKSLGNSMIFLLPWKMSLKFSFCFSIWISFGFLERCPFLFVFAFFDSRRISRWKIHAAAAEHHCSWILPVALVARSPQRIPPFSAVPWPTQRQSGLDVLDKEIVTPA